MCNGVTLHKVDKDQEEMISKAADPGKLKEVTLLASTTCQLLVDDPKGIWGSLLRENEQPNHKWDFDRDFVTEMRVCAHLKGPKFHPDT